MLNVILFLLAFLHSCFSTSPSLPESLIQKDSEVTGVISSLPTEFSHGKKFLFSVDQGELKARQLQLTWYSQSLCQIRAGQRWRLMVRLKPLRGYHNPGSFNYERWALSNNIVAHGSVCTNPRNELLSEHAKQFRLLQLRDQLRKRIPEGPMSDVLQALTLGFGNLLTNEHRDVLQNTGTAHLMAISGLHIGLVSGVIYFIAGWLMRFMPIILLYIPKQRIAAICAILAAFTYSALAGFSVSTIRSLIMVSIFMLGYFVMRRSITWTFLSALALILLFDPTAFFEAGLWLSFGSVALLIYAMCARPNNKSLWWRHGRAQWVCSVGLLPLTVWYFHNVSVAGFIANVVAIPVVSFLVVPLSLLGLVIPICFEPGTWILQTLFDFLGQIDWHVQVWLISSWQLTLSLVAVVVFFLPRGLRLSQLSVVILIPVFFPLIPGIPQGHFRLVTLDVGQGLSCLIQSAHHKLLFDAGPQMDAFDAGSSIVLPYLAHERINHIDTIVISHGDNDHIGGLRSIVKALLVNQFLGSDLRKMPKNTLFCDANIQWDWDGVHFEFLNNKNIAFNKDNNNSCVLRVSGVGGSVLLTGDIEQFAEQWLLTQHKNLRSTIIVVPHHGSKTSSSQEFINAVQPKIAVFSYGFLNRFHHPHQQVVERYQAAQVKILSTVKDGAIEMML